MPTCNWPTLLWQNHNSVGGGDASGDSAAYAALDSHLELNAPLACTVAVPDCRCTGPARDVQCSARQFEFQHGNTNMASSSLFGRLLIVGKEGCTDLEFPIDKSSVLIGRQVAAAAQLSMAGAACPARKPAI